jgi:hypothetical protein
MDFEQTIATLDQQIRASHGRGDLAALARDYAAGGDLYARMGRIDAACFYWTQAWILALDAGDQRLEASTHAHLAHLGRIG